MLPTLVNPETGRVRTELLEKEKGRALTVLQSHGELLFEAPEGEAERLVALVRERMEGVMRLAVPVRVGVGRGLNWAEAHER